MKVIHGVPTSDGAGVNMTRVIGHPGLIDIDPFLLLDEFRSDNPKDYLAGFPDHPHRGFQTVTYMLAGQMRHKDNKGHSGVIGPGGVQWMHAGRGIVHSEMPEQKDGLMWGFQLWVNLAAKEKMTPAQYFEFESDKIPQENFLEGSLKVIAGKSPGGKEGPVKNISCDPSYLDYELNSDVSIKIDLRKNYTHFVYLYEGSLEIQGFENTLLSGHLLLLEKDEIKLNLCTKSDGARFLLVSGKPFAEPIARYGPFVMNTQEEIKQAVLDFQQGRF